MTASFINFFIVWGRNFEKGILYSGETGYGRNRSEKVKVYS